jgi:elongation factor 3
MRDGRLKASGHNWVEGQGSGPRIDKKGGDDDDMYDAMGNKIDTKKQKKLTSSDARKVRVSVLEPNVLLTGFPFNQLKKERMARKKKNEVITDDEL